MTDQPATAPVALTPAGQAARDLLAKAIHDVFDADCPSEPCPQCKRREDELMDLADDYAGAAAPAVDGGEDSIRLRTQNDRLRGRLQAVRRLMGDAQANGMIDSQAILDLLNATAIDAAAPAPRSQPSPEAVRAAYASFMASQGYDDQGRFDHDEMELAFETGMYVQAAAPAPAGEGGPHHFTADLECPDCAFRTAVLAEVEAAADTAAAGDDPECEKHADAILALVDAAWQPQAAPEPDAAMASTGADPGDVFSTRITQLHREVTRYRELLGEIGVMAANAPEDGDSFGVLEEIAMRIAAVDSPDTEPVTEGNPS